ncbi:MAG: helix-turn-helix domain-containing protein, partial [Clostridia bacterium]
QSYTYRCHAGVMETIIPIYLNGETVAYIYLGQYLDSVDVDKQWEFAKKNLDEKFDKVDDEFKTLFYRLKCLPMPFVASSTAILNACFNFIAAECMMQNSPQSDFQLLNEYIKYNYAKNLSITSIANNLSISKSKLCKLAKEHKTTINDMIKERRLKNAKSLLESTVYSISEIASKVGIPDYNYFTILFKKEEGVTPSEYRKNNYTATDVNY